MIGGQKASRVDGFDKVTGEAKYTGDLNLPGLLQAKVLRSPFPHARIESINTEKAAALSGVVAILTRDDLKDINPFYGNCLRDRPLVALDKVRFVGEPVAVVAAEDLLIAEEALALIDVRYHELPCLGTVEDALAAGAPLVHESTASTGEFHDIATVGAVMNPNVCHHEFFERGNVIRGFTEAVQVLEETFEFPMIYQYAMEPHSAVARVNPAGITLWSSSAHPFLVRSERKIRLSHHPACL